ncbi:MAG: hypothetical protein EAX87_09885 [Candidatus Thorarchaeota archaeon]|nr:hypothetical protein [Candidatus Thorarchaeota archaeon]
MQEYRVANSYDRRGMIGIIIPILLLGFVAIFMPFAVLETTAPPPYYPPPPGWHSTVTIYLWAARFDVGFTVIEYGLGGGVTNFYTIPFVIMTLLYFIVHIGVGLRRMPARYGAGFDFVVLLIWVAACQLIYGTLQEWTLIQVPILPMAGTLILLVAYGSQVFQLKPTTPASSSYLSAP